MAFEPFADEAASIALGGLTIENRLDRVSLFGSLDVTRDREGLTHARRLRALLDQAIAVLEGESDRLPARVQTGTETTVVRNPFD
ncbi:hypothetical protein [Roseomonas sp. BN140053]|uniref:hypothetical protein n=1 Tax=Roseomonas sp. BN140053 TaxID=3391898 RepID=UPI0039E8E6A4